MIIFLEQGSLGSALQFYSLIYFLVIIFLFVIAAML